jgi:predicted PurR-regulated permease PerM
METRLETRHSSRLFGLVLGVVVIATLYFARLVLIPIALAVLFAFILAPVVQLGERAHLGRAFSTLLVVLIAAIALTGVGFTVARQLIQVVNELPNYQSNIKQKIDSLHFSNSRTFINASSTVNEIGKELTSPTLRPKSGDASVQQAKQPATPTAKAPLPVEVVNQPRLPLESLENVLSSLASVLIVVVFTIFILIRREDVRNRFISLVAGDRLNVITHVFDEAGNRVGRYLRMQLIVNAAYGLWVGAILYFIGLPGAFLWGVIVGILRFLPYIGPPLGGIAPLILSLAVFPGWGRPLVVLALFVVTELAVSNFIEPVLYGAHTGISSMAILISAIFWTVLWGPIGLVLSTPLTVCLVVLGEHIPHLKFLQILFGDEPVLKPEAHFYQRLLAMDQEEAKQVLDLYRKDKSLAEVYDDVLIPALALAEQDRQRENLDDATAKFICQSTSELVEELAEQSPPEPEQYGVDSEVEAPSTRALANSPRVACLPAKTEADEIAAAMLAQLLNRAGCRAHCVPLGTSTEMLAHLKEINPDVVCISALPPFAIASARDLYGRVREQAPTLEVFVGLWRLTGDLEKAARRLGTPDLRRTSSTLAQMVQEMALPKEIKEGTKQETKDAPLQQPSITR